MKIYNIAALSAGTSYSFMVRLQTGLATGSTVAPTVTIRTYYSINIDYSIIDQINNQAINQTYTNYYTIPNDFSI